MIIQIKDFNNREELETHIKELNDPTAEIQGTAEEFENFNLDDSTKIWGAKCVIKGKSPPAKIKAMQKPMRGEIQKSKIT